MKMPFPLAEDLQWSLVETTRDDLSCAGFIGGPRSEATSIQEWQDGVDMLFRLLKSGLLSLVGWEIEPEISALAQALASQNPYTMQPEFLPEEWRPWQLPWVGQGVYATAMCKELIAMHGIDDAEAPMCETLIDDIETMFARAGVPWTREPLFPVASNAAADRTARF